MRALVLTDFGATPTIADLDIPEPAEGEVRVRVRAASVNGFDLAVAAGYLKDMMEHRPRACRFCRGQCLRRGRNSARTDRAGRRRHRRSGDQAVQLAVKAGAHVIATAHTDEEEALVKALGAQEVVDHFGDVRSQVLASHADGVDVVFHFAGDPAALLPVVRANGRLVSTLLSSADQLPTDAVTVVPISANPDQATLDRCADNQALQKTRVTIQKVYGLEETFAAFSDFTGGTLGKLVITTAPTSALED